MDWQPLTSRLVRDGSKPEPSARRPSSFRELSRASSRMTLGNAAASDSSVTRVACRVPGEESCSGAPCSTAATRHSLLRHAAALTARSSPEMQLHRCSRVSSQRGPSGGVTRRAICCLLWPLSLGLPISRSRARPTAHARAARTRHAWGARARASWQWRVCGRVHICARRNFLQAGGPTGLLPSRLRRDSQYTSTAQFCNVAGYG